MATSLSSIPTPPLVTPHSALHSPAHYTRRNKIGRVRFSTDHGALDLSPTVHSELNSTRLDPVDNVRAVTRAGLPDVHQARKHPPPSSAVERASGDTRASRAEALLSWVPEQVWHMLGWGWAHKRRTVAELMDQVLVSDDRPSESNTTAAEEAVDSPRTRRTKWNTEANRWYPNLHVDTSGSQYDSHDNNYGFPPEYYAVEEKRRAPHRGRRHRGMSEYTLPVNLTFTEYTPPQRMQQGTHVQFTVPDRLGGAHSDEQQPRIIKRI